MAAHGVDQVENESYQCPCIEAVRKSTNLKPAVQNLTVACLTVGQLE